MIASRRSAMVLTTLSPPERYFACHYWGSFTPERLEFYYPFLQLMSRIWLKRGVAFSGTEQCDGVFSGRNWEILLVALDCLDLGFPRP